ncbi:Copia protein [Cyphomyrmex costatus]|uniref:Copia protein n=1 Tax=Cyphomyrmex costatus TaxID=456900 RepID=A0A151I9U8_9HYME|nr:Copia protein [Cyphomyrmex costatus]
MTLDQKDYIESLARKYNITESKLYCTPMEQNLSLQPAQSASNFLNYRNLIGALLYVSTSTRLDISYSVNYLSRFQNSFDESHYKYALRILKYLYLTRDLKLTYQINSNADIIDCFVDADWAGDKVDRKSTTGYLIRIFGNVIFWKSKKQSSVTKSSTAAEYVALSDAVSEIRVILNLLEDLNIKLSKPVKIYEDNSGAIVIAKFGNLTKNSKYIEVHYHFVNEFYEKKIIELVKVESENNIADILTKALGKNKFEVFRKTLNIV